jgi:hypothetical protein
LVIEFFRRQRGPERRRKILEGQIINLLGAMRRSTTSWIYFSCDDWRSILRRNHQEYLEECLEEKNLEECRSKG